MGVSINLGYLIKGFSDNEKRTLTEVARLCKEAGFDYVDCSPRVFLEDEWEKKAYELAEEFSKYGIVVNQAHAPFNRYGSYDKEMFPEYVRRSFEIASVLGAKTIAYHADEQLVEEGQYDSEVIIKKECENLSPYVELAKKKNLIIAVENLFENKSSTWRNRCCSTAEEVIAVIDHFNDSSVGCCWDFGHAAVAFGEEMTEKLNMIGKRLVATHVHDNSFFRDEHQFPFSGKIDWNAQIECLKRIGYTGDITFEFVYGKIPEEVLLPFLKFVYEAGAYIEKNL